MKPCRFPSRTRQSKHPCRLRTGQGSWAWAARPDRRLWRRGVCRYSYAGGLAGSARYQLCLSADNACCPDRRFDRSQRRCKLRGSKNYLGCFKPPSGVLVDPGFLSTLPAHHLRCGMAEIVKIALVRDAKLFAMIERFKLSLVASGFREHAEAGHLILNRSIVLMLEELEQNCFEDRGYQRLVDFGNTSAHCSKRNPVTVLPMVRLWPSIWH